MAASLPRVQGDTAIPDKAETIQSQCLEHPVLCMDSLTTVTNAHPISTAHTAQMAVLHDSPLSVSITGEAAAAAYPFS